jgi:hypothetical protein
MPLEANARKKSLTEMRKAALGLIKLVERQIEEPSGNRGHQNCRGRL